MKRIITPLLLSLTLTVANAVGDPKTLRKTFTQRATSKEALKTLPPSDEQVIRLTAKNFDFSPSVVTVKKGTPVLIELTAKDRRHGFYLPDFGIKIEIAPGRISQARFTPDKVGTFPFACHVFCGEGHEEMTGTLIVKE